jgi:hypothetical protein
VPGRRRAGSEIGIGSAHEGSHCTGLPSRPLTAATGVARSSVPGRQR